MAHFYYDSNVRNHSTIYINNDNYYDNGYKTTAFLILPEGSKNQGFEMQEVYVRELKHN